MLPPQILLDQTLIAWLQEDIGRQDATTMGLGALLQQTAQAIWTAKAEGVIAGLPMAARIFQLLDPAIIVKPLIAEGMTCHSQQPIAEIRGPLPALLTGERVALNLVMHLSGVATLTRQYVDQIADLPTQLVDTRKTTPGLRVFEKYATRLGGATNHRLGLDDAVMVKDNHIAAAGGIAQAVNQIRRAMPYPLTIEVETSCLEQVKTALAVGVNIIMLDNMPLEEMQAAVALIRAERTGVLVEASGNVTLQTLRPIAATGVDYISSSAPITQARWLDLSMTMLS